MFKLMFGLASVILVLSFAGCRSDSGYDTFEWDESDENPFYGETLTIATTNAQPMRSFASVYMRDNPGVNIEVIALGNEIDEVRSRMTVQLMSGVDVPMLIDARLVTQLNRAFFVDFVPLMLANPNFARCNWVMQAFNALSEDGQLIVFPLAITYYYFTGSRQFPGLADAISAKQSLSMSDIINIYHEHGGLGTGFYLTPVEHIMFYWNWLITEYIDLENGHVRFDEGDFALQVEMLRNIVAPSSIEFSDDRFFTYEVARTSSTRHMVEVMSGMPRSWGIFEDDGGFSPSLPIVDDYGNLLVGLFTLTANSWVISTGTTTKQQALAFDFLIFTQNYENESVQRIHHGMLNQPGFTSFFHPQLRPTNLTILDFFVNNYVHGWVDWHRGNGWTLIHHMDETLEAITEEIRNVLDMPMSLIWHASERVDILSRDVFERFFGGTMTADEAALMLQNGVTLILLEDN